MDFSHSDDRRMLADTLARFSADRTDPMARAKLAETAPGYDPALWAGFAELGAIGALFGPDHGGFGGGGFDIMVVFEALGRTGRRPVPLDADERHRVGRCRARR